jgi:hypothetical protein
MHYLRINIVRGILGLPRVGFPQIMKVPERTAELAVECVLQFESDVEGTAMVGEMVEGPRGPDGHWSAGAGLLSDRDVEADLLDGPDAPVTPTGDGHGFDECGFGFGCGLVIAGEAGEEGLEAFAGFAVEDDGAREHFPARVG